MAKAPLSKLNTLPRYASAVLAVALATWMRWLLAPTLGVRLPFITYYLAVMFAAWYGRIGPALVAILLSSFAALYFFIPPENSWLIYTAQDALGLAIFIIIGLFNALLSEMMHSAASRSQQSARSLDENRKRLASVIDSAMDAIITIDENQRVILFNNAAEKMFGVSAAEAIGQPVERFIPEEFREAHREHIAAFNKTNVTRRAMGALGSIRGLRADGSEFPIEASISQVESAGQKLFTVILRDISERLRAEEALRESEERYRELFENANDIIYTLDLEGNITSLNKAGERITGYSREEMLGKPIAQIIAPEYVETMREMMTRKMAGEKITTYDLQIITSDGRRLTLEVSSRLIYEQGKPVGIQGIARDVTERKLAEQAASFLASIVESSDDAIFGKTLDGIILSWNAGAEKMYGYTADEIKGKHVSVLAPEDRKYEITDILEKVRCGEHIHSLETVRRRKDGSLFNVALTISPIIDSAGKIIAASTIARDITDRKRAEQERAQLLSQIEYQRQRLNNIITNVPGVVWEAWGQPDEAGQRIDYVSDYVEKMLGYVVEEWLATPNFWLQIVHPDDKERAAREAREIFEGCVGGTSQFRWLAKDGRVLWVEAQSVVICDDDGKPIGMRGVTMDITERKRAEENERFLAEASKLLSGSLDYETTLASVARLIVPQLADWCAVHIVEKDGQVRQLAVEHVDPAKVERAKELERRYPYDPNSSAGVAKVLRTGQPELYPEISDALLETATRSEEHKRMISELEMRSAMIVPLLARGRRIGAITFASAESNRRYDEADLVLAEDLARRAALAVDNARLYRRAEDARKRLAFVAEASATLASSLDYSTTIESVVRLAVPKFADWCIVDMVEPDGRINRVAVAAADTEDERLLERLRTEYVPTWNSPQPAARALRAGESILLNNLDAESLASTTSNDEHRKIIEKLAPKSIIAVPLIARTRTLGAITFVLSKSARDYTMDDVALAEDLANRAALAVDNARLYKEAQDALRSRDELLEREQAARAEAEEANRAKDEFLATVSHELRTPLNAILGWAHMLRNKKFDEATSARALETIERNAKSQAQLIEDILDVSRIITGKLRLDVQPIELAPIIEAAIDAVRPAADAKGIRLQVILDPRASPVSGDPNRLQQIVWNLASNAVKFTPKGGRVQVRLERVNSHVEIIVSDTGQGISEDFLPHVFDRFRQADASSTRHHGGLGLGLAIVRHLVEMHGGTVQAESEGEGKGATFIVKLPLIVAFSDKLTAERAHPTTSGVTLLDDVPRIDGIRVLVVDDERDTRDLLRVMIEQLGGEVKTCASSGEALSLLRGWKPDVIVSDIEMPGEDGYEFIRKVRNSEVERERLTPAAALTAYARTEDRLRALSAGYQMHVAKPVEPAELAVVISSLVRRGDRESKRQEAT